MPRNMEHAECMGLGAVLKSLKTEPNRLYNPFRVSHFWPQAPRVVALLQPWALLSNACGVLIQPPNSRRWTENRPLSVCFKGWLQVGS